MLVNKLLKTRINASGYYQASTTPGLWSHKFRPILLVLIVDDFSIEYVGGCHIHHLRDTLKLHYTITKDWGSRKHFQHWF